MEYTKKMLKNIENDINKKLKSYNPQYYFVIESLNIEFGEDDMYDYPTISGRIGSQEEAGEVLEQFRVKVELNSEVLKRTKELKAVLFVECLNVLNECKITSVKEI